MDEIAKAGTDRLVVTTADRFKLKGRIEIRRLIKDPFAMKRHRDQGTGRDTPI